MRITNQSSERPSLKLNVWGLCLVFLTPMLGGFLYGFDIGATSFVLSMLLAETDTHFWWAKLGSLQQGLFVSALSLGALLGSLIVLLKLSKIIDRRMEIRVCAILYLIGTGFNVLAGTWLRNSTLGFYALFAGRIIFGNGVGFIMHGAPAYMAEMSPPIIRGAAVSAKETVIVGGIVLGYATGNWMELSGYHWTDIYSVSVLVAFPMLVLTFFIPRSKRWLLLNGLKEEAYESISFVYIEGDLNAELNYLEEQILISSACSQSEQNVDSKVSMFAPRYRSAMIASMGLIFFQQLSGQPSVLSYTTVLLQAAGWSGNASVVTSILMMCMSISTVVFVDRVGRKPLLITCCAIMMTSSFILATCFWNYQEDFNKIGEKQKLIVLISMFLYIGGYQVGFGPVTWCVVSEIFPFEIRGEAIALGVELNYLLNFAVQFAFPLFQAEGGWGQSFVLFGTVLILAALFVHKLVPETKGMTLEEIQIKLSERNRSDTHGIVNEKSRLLKE